MSLKRMNSHEDWEVVKTNAFDANRPRAKLKFDVAWNEHHHKLAITCRREKVRFVQKRFNTSSKKTPPSPKNGNEKNEQHEINGTSWTGLFSFQDVRYAHEQLCLLNPRIEEYPPSLPYETRGVWSFFFQNEIIPDEVENSVRMYLDIAADVCDQQFLIDTLFEVDACIEKYLEDMGELKQREYENDVKRIQEEYEHLKKEKSEEANINMMKMKEFYEREDDVVFKLCQSLAELYNLKIQPFLDLRELAYSKQFEIKESLQDEYRSEEKRKKLGEEYDSWLEQFQTAIETIHDLQVQYFTKCVEISKGRVQDMIADQPNFGRTTWELYGQPRLHNLKQILSQERKQQLEAKKQKYKYSQEKIQQEIAMVKEGAGMRRQVEVLEGKHQQLQLKVFDTELAILQEQENELKIEEAAIKKDIEEEKEMEENEFHDAYESLNELDDDENEKPTSTVNSKLSRVRTKMSRIRKKKANIRNNKQIFISTFENKLKEKVVQEQKQEDHRKIAVKMEKRESETKEKKDFIDAERQKTLQRLKEYKMKYPSPRLIKARKKGTKKLVHNGQGDQNDPESGPPSGLPPPPPVESMSPEAVPTPPGLPPPPPPPGLPPPPPPPPPPGLPPPPPVPGLPPPPGLGSQSKLASSRPTKPLGKKPEEAPASGLPFDAKNIVAARERLGKGNSWKPPVKPLKKEGKPNDVVSEMAELFRNGFKLRKHEDNGEDVTSLTLDSANFLRDKLDKMHGNMNPQDGESNDEFEESAEWST